MCDQVKKRDPSIYPNDVNKRQLFCAELNLLLQSIQEKINKLPFNSFYKQLETQEIQVQSGILDIMNASRNILGI